MTYSAFDISRAIGNNLGNAFKERRESQALDEILTNAMNSGNPEVLQQSFGKILSQLSPERQGPALQVLQMHAQKIQQKQDEAKRRKAYEDKGLDPNLPDPLNQEIYKANEKNKRLAPYGLGGQPQQNLNTSQAIGNPNQPALPGGQQPLANQPIQQNQSPNPLSGLKKEQLIPMLAHPDREVVNMVQAQIDNLDHQEKLDEKKRIEDRKEIIEFHKESAKYDEEIMKSSQIAKRQFEAIKDIEKGIKSGNIKPKSWANVFKGFGTIGDKISNALLNEDEAALSASIPQLLEGWKQVFGVRLSDADLKVLQDKLPSIGKTPEANNAVLRILSKYSEQTQLRGKIAAKIKKDNNGLRPLGYAEKVEERFDEMMKPVKIKNPNTGNIVEIPSYLASDYINDGGVIVNE